MSRLPSPEQAKTRTMPTDDRAIPDDAKSRLVHFFNDNFEIIDEPKPQLGAGLTLAQQAARVYPMEPKYDQSA
jgi:hypothetical protein